MGVSGRDAVSWTGDTVESDRGLSSELWERWGWTGALGSESISWWKSKPGRQVRRTRP